jgi:hypothetical protein
MSNFTAISANLTRSDGVLINAAAYIAPVSNGDQPITVSAAGVKTLTPPNAGSIIATIPCPVDCYVRFGAVPAVGVGEPFLAGDEIVLDSADQIAAAQIYVNGVCSLFVTYYK